MTDIYSMQDTIFGKQSISLEVSGTFMQAARLLLSIMKRKSQYIREFVLENIFTISW